MASDSGIEIVGIASDPYTASEKIIELEPDVMTLDIELPRMNGIEFLKRLMPQYPIPIVVVSAVSNIVFEALNAGAIDFVSKADLRNRNIENFMNELIIKNAIKDTWRKRFVQERKNSYEIEDPSIIILSATTNEKISLHIIYNNVCFSTIYDMNRFMSKFNNDLIKSKISDTCFLGTSSVWPGVV